MDQGELKLPDFFVIGAMKAGTTSLYEWLRTHPDVFLSRVKEIDFFGHDREWRRGIDWYASHFNSAPDGAVVGDCSIAARERSSVSAAMRMAAICPDARLTFIAREPLERARSHYRHEVQRGRERRSFSIAAGDAETPYIADSRYTHCLAPFIDKFPGSQLLVVCFDDIFRPPHRGWFRILDHIGVAPITPPQTVHNVTADKAPFTRVGQLLWKHRLLQRVGRAPRLLRRIGRRVVLGRPANVAHLMTTSTEPLSRDIQRLLEDEVSQLGALIGDVDDERKLREGDSRWAAT